MQQPEVLPNIVSLHGHFKHSDTLNLVLEYANGGTLEDLFKTLRFATNPTQALAFWTNFTKVFNPLFRMHELRYRQQTFRG